MSLKIPEASQFAEKTTSESPITIQRYSDMDIEKTKRRPGTSGELGVLYEKKILMLLLLRALEKNYNFTLDTNIEGAGAFDDVVFTYKDGGGIEQRIYLQAKHKESKDKHIVYSDFMKSGNDDYALYKYFMDYLETVEKFDKIGSRESKYFIIYTNKGFPPENESFESKGKENEQLRIQKATSKDDYFILKKLHLSSNEPLELFSTADSFYQFADKNENGEDETIRVLNVWKTNFQEIDKKKKDSKLAKMNENELDSKLKDSKLEKMNENKLDSQLKDSKLAKMNENELDIFKAIDETKKDSRKNEKTKKKEKKRKKLAEMSEDELEGKLKDYMNALVFAVDQPDEKKLGNEIKREIKQSLNTLSQDRVDFIFEYALKKIDHWKNRSKAKPLTEKDNFFNHGDEKFKQFPALYPTLVYENELSAFNCQFETGKFKELRDFLSSEKKFCLISTSTPWINSLLIHQVLNEKTLNNERNYVNNDNHYFLTWNDLLKAHEIILPAFKAMMQSLLIIVCESLSTVNLIALNGIVGELERIVSASENKVIVTAPGYCELSKQLQQAEIPDQNIILKIEFDDLTMESQDTCLTTK